VSDPKQPFFQEGLQIVCIVRAGGWVRGEVKVEVNFSSVQDFHDDRQACVVFAFVKHIYCELCEDVSGVGWSASG
jgi:hypothetical protein